MAIITTIGISTSILDELMKNFLEAGVAGELINYPFYLAI